MPPSSETAPAPPVDPPCSKPGVMPRISATSSGQNGCGIGGRDRDAETLALKIFQAETGVFEREAHGPGNIFGARFARLAGLRSQTIRGRFTDADNDGLIANTHVKLAGT